MLYMKPGKMKVTQDTEISLGSLFRTRKICVQMKSKIKNLSAQKMHSVAWCVHSCGRVKVQDTSLYAVLDVQSTVWVKKCP